MKILKLFVAFILFSSLVSPTLVKANSDSLNNISNSSVESFIIDELKDGEFIGTKKVNVISEIIQSSNSISTNITVVEDYYDALGNFKESIFKKEKFSNDYSDGNAIYTVKEKKYSTPQTLADVPFEDLTVEKKEKLNSLNSSVITLDHKNKIEKHLSNIEENEKNLKTNESKIQGFTHKDINTLRELSSKIQEKEVISFEEGKIKVDEVALNSIIQESSTDIKPFAVERHGALDTYYNHDSSTGAFVAQGLSASPHKYIKITGNTVGNSTNSSTLTSFKGHVINFEYGLQTQMDAKNWPEVVGWFGVLMGLAAIVAGFASGPVGWVNIVLYYGGALATFTGLTSAAYSSYSRLQLSKNVADYNQKARNLINNNSNWSNIKAVVVPGV